MLKVLDVFGNPLAYILSPGNVAVGNVLAATVPRKQDRRILYGYLNPKVPSSETQAVLDRLFP